MFCTVLTLLGLDAAAQSPHQRMSIEERNRLREELRAQGLSERAIRPHAPYPWGMAAPPPTMTPGHPPPGVAAGMSPGGAAPQSFAQDTLGPPPRPPHAAIPGLGVGAYGSYGTDARHVARPGAAQRLSLDERAQLRRMLRERRDAAHRGDMPAPLPSSEASPVQSP